jgi:cobyrinic acid a,c-diamide synthase
MLDRLQSLGYVEVELRIDSLFGEKGSIMRGHEFHYSRLERTPSLNDGWSSAYLARKRPGKGETLEGFQKGNLLLSYVHMHFASNLSACARFVELCGGRGN